MRTSHWLMAATAVVAMLAVAGCCKGKTETTEDEAGAAATSTEAIPTPPPEEVAPDWKTKCPDADRPASGTVTALKNLDIHEKPDESSKNIGGIIPGTWVNLLGVKQNWLCIDYPTGPGKLSPGWVLATYTKRQPLVKDAGVEAAVPEAGAAATPEAGAAVVDAGVTDSGSKLVALPDAGKTGTTPTSTATTPTGKTPVGGRPPVPRPPR